MLKKDSLIRLAEVRNHWCVSVYMPISEAGAENSLRLKELIEDAREKLLCLGMIPLKVKRMLAPIEVILNNEAFWENRTEGVAAFFAPDSFIWYSLPHQFDELVVVTDRFHLKPLLRNATQSRRFYLLVLSRKQIKFYEASELETDEVYLKGVPKNLAYFLNSKSDPQQQRQAAAKDESRKASKDDEVTGGKKAKLLDIFRKVDKAVTHYLKESEAPLILAGEKLLHPLYQKANSYPHLLKKGVTGEVDDLNPKQLQEKALPVVKPVFRSKREKALKKYRTKLEEGMASNDLTKIFSAAKGGKVETLFVPVGKQKWGIFDDKTKKLRIHQKAKPGDKDLLCVASTRTMLEGGEVFVVLPEQMPGKSSIAAVLRA